MKKQNSIQNKIHEALGSLRLRIGKWILTLFIALVTGCGMEASSQTTLSPGDIAVVAINSTNPDMFSFVLLKSITANTVFHFTDNGFTSTTTPRTGEGFLTFTAPSNMAAGSVITWSNGMNIVGTGFSSNSPATFSFNGSGDQLFIFQGSTSNWSTLNGITLLYGLNYGAALSSTSSASNTVQPSASILPSNSFLHLPNSASANGYFANGTASQTSVTLNGTQTTLYSQILDGSKWFGNGANAATFPSFSFTIGLPTIFISGSLTSFSTIYGTASSVSSYTVSGSYLTNDIIINAPNGFEISQTSVNTGFGASLAISPTGGTIPTTTIYVRLKASATVAGSPYSGQITHTSSGANTEIISIGSSVVSPKSITITGALALNKTYDGTNTAVVTGVVAVGVVNGDLISISGGGIFSSVHPGTNLSVTPQLTLSGNNASSYTLIQPTGLTANIIPANQTISFSLNSSQYTFSSPVLLNGTSSSGLSVTYSSSNPAVADITGNSLIILSSGTTTITAQQSGNLDFNPATSVQIPITIYTPSITEVIFPQYIQGVQGVNTNRVPYAAYFTLNQLLANTTYRYYNRMIDGGDSAYSNGAGFSIFPNPSGFVRSSSSNLSSTGSYGSITTDANGSYSGWFVLEPTGDNRFTPGNDLYMRILLNDGSGGTSEFIRLTTIHSVKVINFSTTPGGNNGSALRGNSYGTAKNFIVVYDHVNGNGRPLSATFVESDGSMNTTANSYASFYSTIVEGTQGGYGMIIPNNNGNGIRRIEQRSLFTGEIIGCAATDLDGVWPGGANTVNPSNGLNPIVITISEAGLWSGCTPSTYVTNVTACDSYLWMENGMTYTSSGTYSSTTVNWCGCDSVSTLNLTIHSSTSSNTNVTACGSFLWSLNGQTYTHNGNYTSTTFNAYGCLHTETLILTLSGTITGSSQHSGCNSFIVDGVNYTSSGYHEHHYATSSGCDSIHTYYVTIYYSNSSGSVHTACNTLNLEGQNYTVSGTYPVTYSNVSGCDSIHYYYVFIQQSSSGASTHTGCNSINLGGQTYTTSGIYSNLYTNAAGCDSIHTYNIQIGQTNTGNTTTTACDAALVDGVNYTSSGFHTHQFTNVSGCDSLHTYHVNIHYSNTGGSVHTGCNTLDVDGFTYNMSGSYPYVYANTSGCDSIHTYYVTIYYSDSTSSFHTACASIQLGGYWFTNSGIAMVTYTNNKGCDSVHTFVVTMNQSSTGSSLHTGCDYILVDSINYTSDGYHTHVFSNAAGCDSVHTFHVKINYSNTGNSVVTACDETMIEGVSYNLSDTFTHVYSNAAGCDSIHTYSLVIHYSNTGSTSYTACDQLTVDGITYTSSGFHSQGYMNESGCDSLHTYYVTIHPSTYHTSYASACDQYTWVTNGMTYFTGGIKTISSINASGCPHTDSLYLTINYSTSGTTQVTSCGSYFWAPPLGNGIIYTSSNYTATNISLNASGCTHTQSLNLIINQSTSSTQGVSACNSYIWNCNGQTYTQSGTYTCMTTNASGCPHITTLNLTVHISSSLTVTVAACNNYVWACNGQLYTQSGLYTCSSLNSNGCMQTTYLNLTLHNSTTSTTNTTSCDQYIWGCNGQTYSQTGSYTCVGTNSSGCSHISILNLVVNQSTTSSTGVSACDSYTWSCNAQSYTQSGIYTCSGMNSSGCFHISTLNLIIRASSSSTINATACNTYTWACNGQTYVQSGNYTCSGINSAGCTQTTTLQLTIGNSTTSSTQITACNNYLWACNGFTYSQSGTYTCTGTNASGCTHVSILQLVINQSTSSSVGISACGFYTWNCNAQTYTQSGVYTCISTNANGCPHVNTLNLTIREIPNVTATNVVACSGSSVTLIGSPSGGIYSLPNPYMGNVTNYIYYYTAVNGCTGSAVGTINYSGWGTVSMVTVTNITSSTANIGWQGYGVWFDVRYKPISSTTWSYAASSSSQSKLITGLTALTVYTVEVRSYCDRFSSPSGWVGITFTTTNAETCEMPIPITTTSITKTSAKLNWSHPGASYFTLRYKLISSTSWINVGTSTTTSKQLSGLLPSSQYEYQVKAVCANSYTSAWSASGFFTTLASKMGEEDVPELRTDFNIYPNPTQDELNVILPAEQNAIVLLKLIDMSGRTVRLVQTDVVDGINHMTISLGDLAKGIYSLQVVNNDQLIHTARVVKK